MKVNKKATGALEKVLAARNTLADPTPVAPTEEPNVVMVNGIPMDLNEIEDPKARGGIELQRDVENGDYTIQGGTLDFDVFDNEDVAPPATDEKSKAEQARQEKLAEIEKDIKANRAIDTAIAARHKNRKNITQLYQPLPADVVLHFPMIDVSVLPKIPYNDVMSAIQWAIDFIIGGRAFVSEPIKAIMKDLAIVKFYTDLKIDDQEDLIDQYDILMNSGAIEKIKATIDPMQLQWFYDAIDKTSDNIILYQNSAAGIIAQLGETANAEDNGLNKIIKTIADNKDVFEKLTPFIEAYEELGTKPENVGNIPTLEDHKKKRNN